MADKRARPSTWDLTALLNAADPRASQPERNTWLIRLTEWLRHRGPATQAPAAMGGDAVDTATPGAVVRLRHLLNVLDRNEVHRANVQAMLRNTLAELDTTSLLADFGFAPRMAFLSELSERTRLALLPGTPQTRDLGELFHLLFTRADDARWVAAIDAPTLARIVPLIQPPSADEAAAAARWHAAFLDAITVLVSQIRSSGFSTALQQRMDPQALAGRPFHQLATAAEAVRELAAGGSPEALRQEVQMLRALLQSCREAAESVTAHLEDYGVSVDVVFQVGQLRERTERVEALLNCILSPHPALEIRRLVAELVQVGHERRSVRGLFARHYSLLARKVAERSAETGEHYITRDRQSYWQMLRAALGGGAVIAGTTFLKFLVMAAGFSAFWGGLWAGVNYAASFVLVHLLHWTVATKQPAMTAPAMAAKLHDVSHDAEVEDFVDEVANLIRSQVAGIVGNIAMVVPVVLAIQLGWQAIFGTPLVGIRTAEHVFESVTLLGPTALYAALTGVLLFASSLVAGWVENWFVWHRLDSAIEWNPRIVARLGPARARRWSRWWRKNISGLASNVSLGLMLGLVPAVATFFGLPMDVRHVTLTTGQIAAAAGAEGLAVLDRPDFWWCVASIPVIGVLNLTVSFFLAFKVALRSRGLKVSERSRLYAAVRHRLRHRPASFLWPPRDGARLTAAPH